MLTEEAVEACLIEGRDALVLLAELVATGGRSSSEVCARARVSHTPTYRMRSRWLEPAE